MEYSRDEISQTDLANVASYYSNMLEFTELFRSKLLFPNMSMTWLDA